MQLQQEGSQPVVKKFLRNVPLGWTQCFGCPVEVFETDHGEETRVSTRPLSPGGIWRRQSRRCMLTCLAQHSQFVNENWSECPLCKTPVGFRVSSKVASPVRSVIAWIGRASSTRRDSESTRDLRARYMKRQQISKRAVHSCMKGQRVPKRSACRYAHTHAGEYACCHTLTSIALFLRPPFWLSLALASALAIALALALARSHSRSPRPRACSFSI